MCTLDGKQPHLPVLINAQSLNLQLWRETEGRVSCVEVSNRFEGALLLLGIVVLTKGGWKA